MGEIMERVVRRLIENGETISTMESCTGGGLANAITNIPDASKVIEFSAVTYSTRFKIKEGVNSEIIHQHTVYSEEVACEMARNISMTSNSTYGVGITGKLKKTDENNPGGKDDVVFLAIYNQKNDEYYTQEIQVHHDTREENKQEVIDNFVKLFLEKTKKHTK